MRNPSGVSAQDRHAVERHTQLVGDDLPQGGRETLPGSLRLQVGRVGPSVISHRKARQRVRGGSPREGARSEERAEQRLAAGGCKLPRPGHVIAREPAL